MGTVNLRLYPVPLPFQPVCGAGDYFLAFPVYVTFAIPVRADSEGFLTLWLYAFVIPGADMPKISLTERIYNRIETLIMDLVPKRNVGPVFKWIFKIPILQYKLGLGWMTGRYILLLTTTGRRTGKSRHTPLEYVYDREHDRYRVAAGWGGNTDWYRNLLANPHVTVQVGRRKFAALAEPAPDEEVARYMMDVSQRHPRMDRVWNRWSDKPVGGSFGSYLYAARFFPSVWLKPAGQKTDYKTLNF